MIETLKKFFKGKGKCNHEWDESEPYSQYCKKCTARRVLMEKKYPIIGEAKIYWKIIDFK